jgi:hypothetical protein
MIALTDRGFPCPAGRSSVEKTVRTEAVLAAVGRVAAFGKVLDSSPP